MVDNFELVIEKERDNLQQNSEKAEDEVMHEQSQYAAYREAEVNDSIDRFEYV